MEESADERAPPRPESTLVKRLVGGAELRGQGLDAAEDVQALNDELRGRLDDSF